MSDFDLLCFICFGLLDDVEELVTDLGGGTSQRTSFAQSSSAETLLLRDDLSS